ncbi:hypothetical protein RFI_00284 [Reticulomyxa filosa]|uniref:Uncharacterized protein n=1 Tax=Reticulomyxa filosa TaxID=46433 RepID=X6PF93_RETFI|nr:hypothetical protein RFI_00284 [Reticulomyxa filosa]|eukprot:ETO36778.1 hypothetical protein RFI_00284 [Reticulomyxa filosa]
MNLTFQYKQEYDCEFDVFVQHICGNALPYKYIPFCVDIWDIESDTAQVCFQKHECSFGDVVLFVIFSARNNKIDEVHKKVTNAHTIQPLPIIFVFVFNVAFVALSQYFHLCQKKKHIATYNGVCCCFNFSSIAIEGYIFC